MHLAAAGDKTVINHNLGAGLKGGDQGLNNHFRVLVGPVMENKSQKVHVSSLHGLLIEKVVYLKADAPSEVCGESLLPLRNDIKRIFDYALDCGAVFGQGLGDVAQSSTNVHHCELAAGTPWKSRNQVLSGKSWKHGMPFHRTSKNSRSARHICECSKDWDIRGVLQTPTLHMIIQQCPMS